MAIPRSEKRKFERSLRTGGAVFAETGKQADRELAEIASFNPQRGVYQVITRGNPNDPAFQSGRPLEVPMKSTSPLVTAPLPLGTVVVVNHKHGVSHIDGVLNVDSIPLNIIDKYGTTLVPGATVSTVETPVGKNFREVYAPVDVLPGDWTVVGPDGNRVSVLLGGYCMMGSGDAAKARFETHQIVDLARIVAENFEMFTGFGVMRVYNSEGKCGMTFRASSDQLTGSGGDSEKWTFKLDIGNSGQLFTMEICEPDGATRAKFRITDDGQITLMGTNGVSIVDAGNGWSFNDYLSNLLTNIRQSKVEKVGGNVLQEYENDRSTTIGTNDNRVVGGDSSEQIMGNVQSHISGSVEQVISGGSRAMAKPTNYAVNHQVMNGTYLIEAGNPKLLPNPAAKASVHIIAHNGTVTLGSHPIPSAFSIPSSNVTVCLNTNGRPGSVCLGGIKATSQFSGVLYEPLQAFLISLMAKFDAHTHVVPSAGTSDTPKPLLSPSASRMNTFKSKAVKIIS